MTTTFPAIVIDTDGTLRAEDLPVDHVWTRRRIPAGIGAMLDLALDVRAVGFVLGHGAHKGTATLLAGANNRYDGKEPINHVATAIVRRYHGDITRPIRGRAIIAAGWDTAPRPIVTPVANALIASWSHHQLHAAA